MKFLRNRVLPLVCALSLVISICVVPASAVMVMPDGFRDTELVNDWNAKIRDPGSTAISNLSAAFGELGVQVGLNYQDMFWSLVDPVVMSCFGEVGIEDLQACVDRYNTVFDRPLGETFFSQLVSGTKEVLTDSLGYLFLKNFNVEFEIEQHPSSGLYRIYEKNTGLFVVSSSGAYPYFDPASGAASGGNQWIAKSTAEKNLSKSEVLTGSRLQQVCTMLQVVGEPVYVANFGSKYKAIYRDGREVYANADGYPFVASANDSVWAVNQNRPDTTVKDDTGAEVEDLPEDNSTNIDLSGMTVTLPDGSINLIDQIIYDESTKTYHIDSHDTFNYTTNYYYEWNYYINYTSITYIGTTEEYNKYYEVYYELPDGRDSADLTAEELEQLNVSIDVIPYGRSADDTSLRSLYHFDGDTHDSSYWNYCTDFTWNKGASLTYMDAGVFEGALYLDETAHDFTLTLPSSLSTTDGFTLQFRYYQSYTAAPQTDSYITIGTVRPIKFNGGYFLNGSGTQLAATPVGSWNEVAVILDSGTLYIYLNGVCIGSSTFSGILSNQIQFHFGSSQQTYKYLDELRVLNYPLATGGAYYECTSVPYDTNLTLVLPDSAAPVADEYYEMTFTEGATHALNLTGNASVDDFSLSSTSNSVLSGVDGAYISTHLTATQFNGIVNGTTASFYYSESYVCLKNFISSEGYYWYSARVLASDDQVYDLCVVVYYDDSDDTYAYYDPVTKKQIFYSPAVAIPGGAFYVLAGSLYFVSDPAAGSCIVKAVEFYSGGRYTDFTTVCSDAIAYQSDFSFEKVSYIAGIDTDSMNTPTLAVRTDLDITSYQIGGVRPSLPVKGQVWALVESGYITSIQIYNGTAWESVDGRMWTGSRWIPASSYNVITLQDMYDIVDATQNYEYIYSESGFWSWWQKSWNSFTEKLFNSLGSGSSGSGASELDGVDLDAEDVPSDPDSENAKSLWQFVVLVIAGGKSVITGVRHLFSGVVSSVPNSMESVSGAFDTGGIAVGVLDGTSRDPDAVDTYAADEESEVLDPWRYR